MKKNALLISLVLLAICTVTVLLPAALVSLWPSKDSPEEPHKLVELQVDEDDVQVRVLLKDQDKVVTMPLEKYVRGVVAAEMPITFEKEALKAQAIAARTYIVRRLASGATKGDRYDVSDDHTESQAFSSDEKLQQRWGMIAYAQNLSKLNEAVNETKGQILLYDGKPIEALFFSTSSGRTENSEDYWDKTIPYLRSVPSPWDEQSDKYTSQTSMQIREMQTKLGVTAVLTAANLDAVLKPLEKTATEHIKKIQVGDKTFSGREFREKLGLRSTWFTWKVEGDTITFFNRGFGHGVGLSQYGANGMAKEGYKAEQIVKHYYQGVEIADVKRVLPP
jgi:stage II sporulation protein D